MTILFSEKVLVQLNLTLVTKSDAYNDSSLRYIFRLNNSHYLLSALKRSGLLDLLKVRHKQFFKVVLVIFQIFRNKNGEVKLIFYPLEPKRRNSAAEYGNSDDGKRKRLLKGL